MGQPGKDEVFERFVAEKPPGVADAARMIYYGVSYRRLFNPVVTASSGSDSLSTPRTARPVHTDDEQAEALEAVRRFEDEHPGRSDRYDEP
ncbi:hypothetical protein GF380_01375 [Candidatus Uhrbacteria bacterium]|nr:hypothetical protein [Candidatus Uhrbacteria bacterium]MBD3283930.1 hypothetical protein [Candidatus Uhrbacteria bacterium]